MHKIKPEPTTRTLLVKITKGGKNFAFFENLSEKLLVQACLRETDVATPVPRPSPSTEQHLFLGSHMVQKQQIVLVDTTAKY